MTSDSSPSKATATESGPASPAPKAGASATDLSTSDAESTEVIVAQSRKPDAEATEVIVAQSRKPDAQATEVAADDTATAGADAADTATADTATAATDAAAAGTDTAATDAADAADADASKATAADADSSDADRSKAELPKSDAAEADVEDATLPATESDETGATSAKATGATLNKTATSNKTATEVKAADTARTHATLGLARNSGYGTISRPREMYLAAAFLTVAALPLVLAGLALMLQLGAIEANLKQKVLNSGSSVDADSVVLLVRVAGVFLLLLGLAFIALTWFALKPRRWARAAASILAGVEIVLLVVAMVVTAPDPVSLGLILLAGAGAALLYLPRSEEFLLAQQ